MRTLHSCENFHMKDNNRTIIMHCFLLSTVHKVNVQRDNDHMKFACKCSIQGERTKTFNYPFGSSLVLSASVNHIPVQPKENQSHSGEKGEVPDTTLCRSLNKYLRMSCSKKSSWSYLFFFLFKHLQKQVYVSEFLDKEITFVY